MLIVNHTKCTASVHYYFLSEKKFPQIFFSWFWKTCEGYVEVHLLNPHLWKICWEIKLPYEYIFSFLWMSVPFGMLCVLSKRSVFAQEGFWTFIWIHPRSTHRKLILFLMSHQKSEFSEMVCFAIVACLDHPHSKEIDVAFS